MSESLLSKNLADKRREIKAYIGSLERDLEKARRDLSAIMATEHIFQSRGPNVTAYMELSYLFPRHELPNLAKAALGSRYDLRDFDDTVVKGGNVPLDVLAKNVADYVARTNV